MMAKKTKLLEARFKKGFSQDQMADMLGMTQSNYSRKKTESPEFPNMNGIGYLRPWTFL
ncbi:helix-turn-helix domain-containing protein [uncultured Chryseobacterium sp.]|uniref:helix-turn-helix domain-containing protein n=1 Tax=uncultured Chryseobacterium sp. TaxID=259322 RepID=UPI0025FDA93F|nr:helix-turn-helix domain-containing protein [uncultured Chryseobacterium sp.]